MAQFFQSIWQAISSNWAATGTTLGAGTLITIIVLIVKMYLNGKTIKSNTAAVVTLTESSKNIKSTEEAVQSNTSALTKFSTELESTEKELVELKETYACTEAKLNAIIDAMLIAYSTIKNDDMRTTINSILTNCKFSEANTIAKLEAELNALREKFAKATETMQKDMDVTVGNINETIKSVSRY